MPDSRFSRFGLGLRTAVAVLAASVVLAAIAAVAATPSAVRSATRAVSIGDGSFSPAALSVAVGDTVTWTNDDDSPHTVTGAAFDSGNLEPGQTFSFTFTEAGTFSYVCSYHEEMVGSVAAVAATAPAPAASAPADAGTAPPPAASAAAGTHEATTHGSAVSASGTATGRSQPNTAVLGDAASPIPGWLPVVLIGLGLLAFGFAVLPLPRRPAASATPVPPNAAPRGGWRR